MSILNLAQSTDEAPLDLIVIENYCGQTLSLNVFIFLYKRFVKYVVAYEVYNRGKQLKHLL